VAPFGAFIDFDLIADIAKLSLIVYCLQLALRTYVHHCQPTWSRAMEKRRLAILLILVLAVSAIKLSEDVLGGESGVIDEEFLLFVHSHVSGKLMGFLEAVTLTGSAAVLFPLTISCAIVLLLARRRFEAMLLSASVLSAAAVVYGMKTAVGRIRPALWETDWYWGSSFPSGHTLVVAAFAAAAVLCMNRVWPSARAFALAAAISWIFLVALSRLALGAHWPTDVLAAACIGAILPLVMSVVLEPLTDRA
jgi:undecaprenyl-diphosphatase